MNAIFPALMSVEPRIPPTNLQAEQALLGAILANNRAYERVAAKLLPHHFADPANAAVFRAVSTRIRAGQIADVVTLKQVMESDGSLAEVGGTGYLAQLLTAMVGIINAADYADAVIDAWKRRCLIDIGEQVVNGAFGAEDSADDIQARAVSAIEGAFGAEQSRRATSLDDALDAEEARMEAAASGDGMIGLSTGFASLDGVIGGLEDGTMHIIAGRPGMGKSALGWQIALNVAAQGIGVLVVSLEMSAPQLARRALSLMSGVPLSTLRSGRLTTGQAASWVQAKSRLRGLPLSIEDLGGLTAAQIDLAARAAHRRHGLGMMMVDHLHIVRPEVDDMKAGATWAVGRISGAMKAAAKRHSIPVMVLAQLNRGVEGRDDKRPTLADLRQSGDIEQDADTVSLLYRPEYYLREPEQHGDRDGKLQAAMDAYDAAKTALAGKAEVILAKVRDGEPQTVQLRWDGPTTSFQEYQ